MAAKSTLLNMVTCLTAVCLVCSAILAGLYALTAEPIANAAQKALVESITKVLPEGGELSESQSCEADGVEEYYLLSDEQGSPLAYAVKTSTNGFGGTLSLMVGVLPDGTVYNTSVLAHAETPGLGAKCAEDESAFRQQFRNFAGKLLVKKDGGDIDAITASTITSRAFTLCVKQAVDAVKALNTVKEETVNE